ncbi:MAG: peptide chain release factor N(5)-glutamine methyltransferase [Capsulimonadaceae bacterium]|nr:peptide chain release factor N(5)-glutamine methyltransferase [Capsulimonadaceae bacterium]
MPTSPTVAALLLQAAKRLSAAGIDTARLDAQLLLAMALRGRREDLARAPERLVSVAEQEAFARVLAEREKRRPLAYVLGESWFHGHPFFVGEGVLVPRPETEMLADLACERAPSGGLVADIGTGSGCIALSIALARLDLRVMATEISETAMGFASRNASRHGVGDRVAIALGDLLAPLASTHFNVIVSNPPYIATGDVAGLMPEVRDYEPSRALYEGTGADGLAVYRRLIPEAVANLTSGGWLAVEVGLGQARHVERLYVDAGYNNIEVLPDFANIERVVAGQWLG